MGRWFCGESVSCTRMSLDPQHTHRVNVGAYTCIPINEGQRQANHKDSLVSNCSQNSELQIQ